MERRTAEVGHRFPGHQAQFVESSAKRRVLGETHDFGFLAGDQFIQKCNINLALFEIRIIGSCQIRLQQGDFALLQFQFYAVSLSRLTPFVVAVPCRRNQLVALIAQRFVDSLPSLLPGCQRRT